MIKIRRVNKDKVWVCNGLYARYLMLSPLLKLPATSSSPSASGVLLGYNDIDVIMVLSSAVPLTGIGTAAEDMIYK